MPEAEPSDRRLPLDARAVVTTVVCCFVWGLQQVAIKAAGEDMSSMLQVSVRSAASLALLMLWSRFVIREKWNPDVRLRHGLLTGLCFAGEFFFVAEGLRYTSASHMAVLLYTAPLFSAVGLAFKLPEERLSRLQWTGVLTAFGGVAFSFAAPALASGSGVSGQDLTWLWGDLLALCSGISWGLSTIVIRTTTMNRAAAGQMLFWELSVAFVVLFPTALLTGQTVFNSTPVVWSSMIFQVVIVSFASYLAWCALLRRYLAARLGALAFLTPVFGVALGVVLLDEELDASFLIGAALVILGIVLVQSEDFLKSRLARKAKN